MPARRRSRRHSLGASPSCFPQSSERRAQESLELWEQQQASPAAKAAQGPACKARLERSAGRHWSGGEGKRSRAQQRSLRGAKARSALKGGGKLGLGKGKAGGSFLQHEARGGAAELGSSLRCASGPALQGCKQRATAKRVAARVLLLLACHHAFCWG